MYNWRVTDGQLASRGKNYLIKIHTYVLIHRVMRLDRPKRLMQQS